MIYLSLILLGHILISILLAIVLFGLGVAFCKFWEWLVKSNT
jgi:hypothetical protein